MNSSKLVVASLLLLLLGTGCIFVRAAFPPEIKARQVSLADDDAHIKRGEYLANHVAACFSCHADRDWSKYSGPAKVGTRGSGGQAWTKETTGFPGKIYATNISPAAYKNVSDSEFLRAITAGMAPDDTPLFPTMPYRLYGRAGLDDMGAITSYLRTIPAVEQTFPERELSGPLPLLVRAMPMEPIFEEPSGAPGSAKYGEYLANLAMCTFCHSQDKRGELLPGLEHAGDKPFQLPSGGTVYSSNITPDKETGIGNWTADAFVTRFKAFTPQVVAQTSIAPGEKNSPMPWADFSGMSDEDLRAIFAFLQEKPAVRLKVKQFQK